MSSVQKFLFNFWQFFSELNIAKYKGQIAHILQFLLKGQIAHILQFLLKTVEHLRKDFERVKCSI